MSLKEKQAEIVEDFAIFDNWLDKYEYLIELAKNLDTLKEDYKTEKNLIKGCQSRVWLNAELKDGKIILNADSDALITKGIISLLVSVYSDRTPQEIINDDFSFLNELGLKENLSPTRANGLVSMINTIKRIAEENA